MRPLTPIEMAVDAACGHVRTVAKKKKPPRKDKGTMSVLAACDSLVSWWKTKEPDGWNEETHLKEPCVNCSSSSETVMAFAAANLVRLGWDSGDNG